MCRYHDAFAAAQQLHNSQDTVYVALFPSPILFEYKAAHLVLEVPLRGLPDLLGLEVLLLDPRLLPAAALVEDPPDEVIHRLGRRDDVEGRRHRPALLEVRDPQLGAGELPLHVGLFRRHRDQLGEQEINLISSRLTCQKILIFVPLSCDKQGIS